ncbi:cytochrome and DOMON domain-containing protein [Aspergillus foveolatus]|uniref:cytochrome and DOMON domain-containing protein n=1 Tax=Aspergillus foveolatus TaxID=210207 RepID=UPI003CCD9226
MKYSIFSAKTLVLGLCSFVGAHIDTFSPGGQSDIFYSITAPKSTVRTGSGPIFFQIRAPTTLQWVALGQGTQMAGADIFVLYSSSTSNVTLSPRLGTGHVPPRYNPDANLSLLEGSGVQNGVMTANVRCDTCNYSASSSWIFAYREGTSLDSESLEAEISIHNDFGSTNVALANAVSTMDNPFLDYDPRDPMNQPSEVGGDARSNARMLIAHGFIMSITFVLLFPFFGLLVAIPVHGVVAKVHAPLQTFTLFSVIAGMGLGLKMGTDGDILDHAHPILGLIVVGLLILLQPAMGLLQHLHFRRTGKKSIFAILHRWLGRLAIILGIITGGLGFNLVGIDSSPYTPKSAVIAYSVIAGVMGLVYVAVQVLRTIRERARSNRDLYGRKAAEGSTETGTNSQDA